jgi:hypothetical protein
MGLVIKLDDAVARQGANAKPLGLEPSREDARARLDAPDGDD